MTTKEIKDMDHCVVVSKKKLKGSGLEVGDEVMVIGTTSVQDNAKDPYLKRTYTTVIRVSPEGHHFMPSNDEGNHDKAVMIDPRRLEKLGPERTKFLVDKLTEQFS